MLDTDQRIVMVLGRGRQYEEQLVTLVKPLDLPLGEWSLKLVVTGLERIKQVTCLGLGGAGTEPVWKVRTETVNTEC